MPTSVLLAVLAAAGLLALAPALVRRYDATERLAAERALSTARVIERRRRPRTVPGRRPVNPPRLMMALASPVSAVPVSVVPVSAPRPAQCQRAVRGMAARAGPLDRIGTEPVPACRVPRPPAQPRPVRPPLFPGCRPAGRVAGCPRGRTAPRAGSPRRRPTRGTPPGRGCPGGSATGVGTAVPAVRARSPVRGAGCRVLTRVAGVLVRGTRCRPVNLGAGPEGFRDGQGLWRRPVAHLVRIEGVRGSNPLSSTSTCLEQRKRWNKIARTRSGPNQGRSWLSLILCAALRSAVPTTLRRRCFLGHQCT